MRIIIVVIALFIAASFHSAVYGQSARIKEGNEEYAKNRFRNAESAYRKALEKNQKMFEGNYNLGNALYKQNKFEEASQQYMNASVYNQTPEAQNKSLYNLGNAFLKEEKYKESIEAYKKALKINPDDEDARYNLSYALQKLKKEQQNNKSDKKDQQQDKKDQQQNKQDQQKQDQQQQQQQQQQQDQQKQQQQRPKLSKEEAERMLRALKNDEKDLQKEKAKKFSVSSANPEKNW